jgi:hypothetical protein
MLYDSLYIHIDAVYMPVCQQAICLPPTTFCAGRFADVVASEEGGEQADQELHAAAVLLKATTTVVVVDEAHMLKHYSTRIGKALCKVREAMLA